MVIGGKEASYGAKNKARSGFRGELESEVGNDIDWSRVHFLGSVPYADFLCIIQASRCHVYLAVPFVLSLSLLEAMAMEAIVVASDVPPVREAVEHEETGSITDFFDPVVLADRVAEVLNQPSEYAHVGSAARASVIERYEFETRCLPEHLAQINSLLPSAKRIDIPN